MENCDIELQLATNSRTVNLTICTWESKRENAMAGIEISYGKVNSKVNLTVSYILLCNEHATAHFRPTAKTQLTVTLTSNN
jgi:hypothetical protein